MSSPHDPSVPTSSHVRTDEDYRDLVEHANSIILRWAPDGRVLFLNEFGQRFFGYRADEIVGRHVLDTLVPASDSHGRDLERLMRAIRANPTAYEQNVNENVRRTGERAWIAWTNRVERGPDGEVAAILSVGTDITARVRADEALRASEARFRGTLDSILEACQLVGFDWRYLYINDAAVQQNRRPREEMLGRTVMECWPGIEQTVVYELLHQALLARIAQHRELEFTFPDGATGWFDVRTHPVPEGVFLLSIDITENKRAERALREMNEVLERRVAERTAALHVALERAESADRLKSSFLATMSHELRTPLNSIIGFTSIVAQGLAGPINNEQARQLGMVRNSARHLLDLINDVLDLSKIEAEQLALAVEPVIVNDVCQASMAFVKELAHKKRIKLACYIAQPDLVIRADARRLKQMVVNLLSNAVKFTPEDGAVELNVTVDEDRREVRIAVRDNGIGIAAADLPKLFQPFTQLDAGLNRKHDGTGLGLALVKNLAAQHGGAVTVESAGVHGEGSCFTIVLPHAAG